MQVVEGGLVENESTSSFDQLLESFALIDKQILSLNSEDDDDSFTEVSN